MTDGVLHAMQLSMERVRWLEGTLLGALTIAALALLAVVGAYWTWEWLAPRPVPRAPMKATTEIQLGAASTLFGSVPSALVATPAAGADSLRLVGVVAATEGRDAYAIVVLNSQQVIAAKPGDEVSPGVKLVEVAARHVVLTRNGLQESIALPEKGQAATDPAVPRNKR